MENLLKVLIHSGLMEPNGDDSEQVRKLQDKIEKWSTITKLKRISKVAARMAVKMTIGRTILYPLMATAMTELQCKKVQRTFLDKVLGSIGVGRSASIDIATGMACYGGLGLYDIYLQQTLAHIGMIANHGHSDTVTGSLLRTTLELYALENGMSGDPGALFEVDYDTPNTWIAQTKKSLHHYNITISTGYQGLQTWIENDVFIMVALKQASTQEKRIINKVRLFLQVVTLADLLRADGKTISSTILHGIRSDQDPTPSKNKYRWPKVDKPTQAEIQVWSNALRAMFVRTGMINQQTVIHGVSWTNDAVLNSTWVYSNEKEALLYRQDKNIWQVFRRQTRGITRAKKSIFIAGNEYVSSLPMGSIPASISRQTTTEITLLSTGHISNQQQEKSNKTPWVLKNVKTCGQKEQTIIKEIQSTVGGEVVSDGSYKDGRTTYAFVAGYKYSVGFPALQDLQNGNIIGQNRVPGHPHEQHSYRGELAGILAAITYINSICAKYRVTSGHCRICCDNQGALKASFGRRQPNCKWASYDLVSSIRYQLRNSKITWSPQYIAAHQDTHTEFADLSPTAQANVLADHLACLAHTMDLPQHDEPLPGQPWIIKHNGQYVGGNINTILQNEINKRVMQRKWTELFGLTEGQSLQSNWDVFFSSFKGRQPWQQQLLTKYLARILPTGVNLRRRGHAGTAICPGCGEEETSDHLFICKNERITETFLEHTQRIQDYLSATAPQARAENITLLLTAARNGDLVALENNSDQRIRDQAAMGQRALVAGLWHQQWTYVEPQDDQKILQRKANKWLLGLIKKIQDLALDMWYTRNEVLHRQEENMHTTAKHLELNIQIDSIFKRKPHDRLLTHTEAIYFSRKSEESLKKLRLQRKQDWVDGAEIILEQKRIQTDKQAAQFVQYFQWDRG